MFEFSAATVWALLSICLVILEIMMPGIWFIWFTIPAIVTAFATYFWDLGLIAQLAVFIVLVVITMFLLFKFGRKNMFFNKEDEKMNHRGTEYLGHVAILDSAVVNGVGRIKLGDTSWTLNGEDCPEGTQVRITKLQLNALYFEIIKRP